MMMACSSSEQHILAGDEPLGLLCSEAASDVMTMWPVTVGEAEAVSVKYFSEVEKAARVGGGRVNMASCMQRPSRQSSESLRPPRLGQFVLHGSSHESPEDESYEGKGK